MAKEISYRKYAKVTGYMRGVLDERRRHEEDEAFERQEWVQDLLKARVKVVKKDEYIPRHLKGVHAPKHFKAESETSSCQELIHEIDMIIDESESGRHFEEPEEAPNLTPTEDQAEAMARVLFGMFNPGHKWPE